MTKEDIFRDFLEKCREYDENFTDFFRQFLDIIIKEHVIEEIRLKKRKIPIPFNILRIFKNHTNEVKNSTLLKEILNAEINGTCLRVDFIQYLNTLFNWNLDIQAIQPVEIEKYCDNSGRIDIFIEGKNFTLIIENKIDAGDQDRQLERYTTFVRDTYPTEVHVHVIYLTRWGYEPSEISLSKEERTKLGKNFMLLKHGNIGQWIEQLLEKDQYACIKTNQAYKYLYSGLVQFMYTELLLSNMAQEDNVTKETIKKILQKYFSEKGKISLSDMSLSDMEEYRSLFSNAAVAIDELIKEKECENFLKENNVEKDFDFADRVVKIVMNKLPEKGITYSDYWVKNFENFKTALLEKFYTRLDQHLLDITIQENICITIEIGYGYKEYYGAHFGIWVDKENSTLEKILKREKEKISSLSQYWKPIYSAPGWIFLYEFKQSEGISAQKIADDIMKLCELCK